MSVLAAGVGAGLGAMLRFMAARALAPWSGALPLGTLAANVVASLVYGWAQLDYAAQDSATGWSALLLVAGLAGGLSTFSTLAQETVAMLQEREFRDAALNAGLNILGGLAAVGAGHLVGVWWLR